MEKKDLISAKKQFEDLIVNSEVNIMLQKASLDKINEELKKFPDEKKDDPMPENLKEVVNAIK